MPRSVLIVERHPEVADALEQVIASADCSAIVRAHLDGLDDVNPAPAAIVVRITFEGRGEPAHAGLARLPADHPPIIAIVRADEEAYEAARLKCDVVLRAPYDLGKLRNVLSRLMR
jgi:hypothetical protein